GGGDLQHFGVQPLTHLGTAVVDEHRAVFIDEHKGPALVECREVERNPEFNRCHRERSLDVRIAGIKFGDCSLPGFDVGVGYYLIPGRFESIRVPDRLVVGRILTLGIEIATTKLSWA